MRALTAVKALLLQTRFSRAMEKAQEIFMQYREKRKHARLVFGGVSDTGIMGSGAAAICLLVSRTGSHDTARHMGETVGGVISF